jgi:hypothetical protein
VTAAMLFEQAIQLLERQQLVIDAVRLENATLRGELKLLHALVDRIVVARPGDVLDGPVKRTALVVPSTDHVLCRICGEGFTPGPFYKTVCRPCRCAMNRKSVTEHKGPNEILPVVSPAA